MRVLLTLALALGLSVSLATADDVKSGPGADKSIGGAFQVKAITGDKAGKTLCYVCQYNAQKRPAVVLIFTQKADDNLVSVVKAVDAVQKAEDKDGPEKYTLNKDAAVTVLVYKEDGKVQQNFAFKTTKEAADKAKDIAAAAEKAVK